MSSRPRIDWVTNERVSFLTRETGEVPLASASDATLRDTSQFILLGNNMVATCLITRTSSLTAREAIDLLVRIEERLKNVVERGVAKLSKNRTSATHGSPGTPAVQLALMQSAHRGSGAGSSPGPSQDALAS